MSEEFEAPYNHSELDIHGIKCDNKDCDYVDMSIPSSEYDQWLNKPCPKCGENLLTQEDYDNVKQMEQLVQFANGFSPEEIQNILDGMNEDEIDRGLDFLNKTGLKKIGETEDGREIWRKE